MAHAQADVKIQNAVTLGANALNNNSNSYASYAILVDQAIGHAVRPSLPPWVFLLANSGWEPACT